MAQMLNAGKDATDSCVDIAAQSSASSRDVVSVSCTSLASSGARLRHGSCRAQLNKQGSSFSWIKYLQQRAGLHDECYENVQLCDNKRRSAGVFPRQCSNRLRCYYLVGKSHSARC